MRLCIERDEAKGESRLMAVSNPTKPIVRHDDLMATLERYEGRDVRYCDGMVESSHVPRAGGNSFEISGDAFSNRFASDGRIYVSNNDGTTFVAQAGPKFRLLAKNNLGERITASPAITGDWLIIRTDSRLYCIGKQ
ncbi:MAG: hypothetical protein H8E66_33275 [Planctomycetes bacterium]|nr:hypothetical protein [Planctomycetota bacterium]